MPVIPQGIVSEGQVVEIDGICYIAGPLTDEPVTHETVDAVYDDCQACVVSSSQEELSSATEEASSAQEISSEQGPGEESSTEPSEAPPPPLESDKFYVYKEESTAQGGSCGDPVVEYYYQAAIGSFIPFSDWDECIVGTVAITCRYVAGPFNSLSEARDYMENTSLCTGPALVAGKYYAAKWVDYETNDGLCSGRIQYITYGAQPESWLSGNNAWSCNQTAGIVTRCTEYIAGPFDTPAQAQAAVVDGGPK